MKATCWMGKRHVEVVDVPDPQLLDRRDAIFQLLGVQLDCAGVLARRGLDLRLLLLGQFESDVLLLGHGALLAGDMAAG